MDTYDGDIAKKNGKKNYQRLTINGIKVKKADKNDIKGIFKVAASVGNREKDSYSGFLMDNYQSNPDRFINLFERMVIELDYFYVAVEDEILGFLMAFTKEQWLVEHPKWIEDVFWSPEFEFKKTDSFAFVDKIAIMRGCGGKGVGSAMYKRFISDLKARGVEGVFSETIIYPIPNFASLSFRKKQKHMLAGIRYEAFDGKTIADGVYYKPVR